MISFFVMNEWFAGGMASGRPQKRLAATAPEKGQAKIAHLKRGGSAATQGAAEDFQVRGRADNLDDEFEAF